MSTARAALVRRSHIRPGFTLVELLVVIAIIALLAALLFPVFAKVREKSRQATALSNLSQIQAGMALYQLDHHVYPPVLFGYAYPGASMQTALQQAQTAGASVVYQYFPGLYPTYVKDNYQVFQDPNDPASASDASATTTVSVYGPDPTNLTTVSKTFYTADAFDLSPQVTGQNTVADTTYVPRYQLSWTGLNAPAASAAGTDYQRQLRWRSQPGNTYVTCTTYHVENADKVLVLFEAGNTKVMDSSVFLKPGPDVSPLPSSGNPNFWKVQP